MRGDLQHGIGGGVNDGLETAQMRLAIFLDDRGARSVFVAENAGQSRFRDQGAREGLGKRGLGDGKVTPGEIHRRASDLPMAGGRVLAARGLDAIAPLRARRRTFEARRLAPRRGVQDEAETHGVEVRQTQRPGAQAGAVALPERAGLRDMAERIGARVAIISGVFGAAAADGIQHDDHAAGHGSFLIARQCRWRRRRSRTPP